MNTTADSTSDNTSRPFGFWLKAVDRLMAHDFATAFAAEGATRRDWRLLNVVDGTVPARRPLHPHKLHDLVDRGWVEADGDGWALTDEGRAAKERLGAAVDGIRAKVAGAVSDEEMATTLAALEKIARAFGWDEETPLPRKRRPGFGFGPPARLRPRTRLRPSQRRRGRRIPRARSPRRSRPPRPRSRTPRPRARPPRAADGGARIRAWLRRRIPPRPRRLIVLLERLTRIPGEALCSSRNPSRDHFRTSRAPPRHIPIRHPHPSPTRGEVGAKRPESRQDQSRASPAVPRHVLDPPPRRRAHHSPNGIRESPLLSAPAARFRSRTVIQAGGGARWKHKRPR